MSSTNRGGKRSDADFYATPAWCVRRLLEAVNLPGGEWIEPCAGDGSIIRAVKACDPAFDCMRPKWSVVELRPEMTEALTSALAGDEPLAIGDFFEVLTRNEWAGRRFDVVLTNPPFSLAMQFIRACESIATHRIFLLRLNFLGSEERSSFIRDTTPDIYVLPNRPSFTGGGTDSIEYAWFHWWPGSSGRYKILWSTPKEERKRKA